MPTLRRATPADAAELTRLRALMHDATGTPETPESLQLANAGKLDAVKVGDTWVIPRQAVTARRQETAERRSVEVVSYT